MTSDLRRTLRRPRPPRVDLSHPARSPLGNAVVNCVVYEDGRRREAPAGLDEALTRVRRSGRGFVWIGLHEPDDAEFADLAERFALHPLAVSAAMGESRRPKAELYGDTLLTVLRTVTYVEHRELTATSEVVDSGELVVFTGPDFVISVRRGNHGSLGPVRESLEADPDRLALGPAAVLHAVADRVVDDYLAVVDAVQDDIDAVEAAVCCEDGGRTDAGHIYQLKRELLELKRAVTPLARPLHTLATRPAGPVDGAVRPYFRDVADHLAHVVEQVTVFDGLLDSVLQAHLAQVTIAQNEDMRRITAWAGVIAVPTMVCGVYGMNFHDMPELTWSFGYPLVMGVTAVVCFLVHRSFRHKGWL
ncbi:magnesium and cobalt transport protein CorA [Streptomyces sp. NPDC059740]|uniref:magnesium and cobalt transport protein CorA n=1 Tax=Streptomyces sp. NPDC059740 TaxID=3346926 RepID=UPI00365D5090